MSYRLDVEPEDWYPEYNDYWTEERFEAEEMAQNESDSERVVWEENEYLLWDWDDVANDWDDVAKNEWDSERVVWEEEDVYDGVFEWFDSNEYFIFQFEELPK